MSDSDLTYLAAIFELGLPIALAIVCAKMPTAQRVLTPVLGAISPILLAYLAVTASHMLAASADTEFAFGAMWVMSFLAYAALSVIGLVVGLTLNQKYGNKARYWFGLLVAPICAAAFIGIANFVA